MATKRVLMVEGFDDEHVVKSICGRYGLGEIETIRPYQGKDALLAAIGVRVKESDISAVGIILDADTDLHARWQAIIGRLSGAGYRIIPAAPASDGTVILPPAGTLLPKVGIWLMPDNTLPGMLEDFLRFLVPEDDAVLAHAEASVNANPKPCRFAESKRPKALIHTWLAWQEEPGKPLGQAISARYLDANLPAGRIFADWLRRIFFS